MTSGSGKAAFFTFEDAKASFNLFCCVCGIGSLAMPSNYARAGPFFASIALAFMIFANTYATLKLSKIMLVAPSSVKTYGDLGEWALGKYGRFLTVVSQMGVCLLVPCAFLVLGSTLLDVLFPDCFSQTVWIIFMAIMVVPVCLIPTLKESAGMAFAGCMGTVVADIIAVVVLQWNMRGHDSIPSPDVTAHQLSGNILYSIVSTSNPLGLAPLGFTADRGAVVMAYLFMQMHISIAFSTLMMPPFYMAERLILGMHKGPEIERFNPDRDQVNVDHDMELHEKQSYIQSSTPLDGRQVSAASMIEKSEGRMSHLRVALEFGEEITEEELHAPYKSNTLRYIALRIAIIAILVVIAVLARKRFLDLQDFTGATAHTTSCLLMPLIIYMRVSWRTMSVYDKGASMIVIVACAFAGFYVMIHAGKHLFAPTDDDTLFPYCEEAFMDAPYYVRNNSTN
ncbi:hypothetical protein PF003_g19794 [Phytophthora fragariae]|nr:hypothetical protein PF003_g19794 [Phytophthora fragariae]